MNYEKKMIPLLLSTLLIMCGNRFHKENLKKNLLPLEAVPRLHDEFIEKMWKIRVL